MTWKSAGGSQTFMAYGAIEWGTGATNRAGEWPWHVEQVVYHGPNSANLDKVRGVRMIASKT